MNHRAKPAPPRLTEGQIRQLLTAEKGGQQPDCFSCGAPVTAVKATVHYGKDEEIRVATVWPCGHRWSYNVRIAEQVEAQMRLEAATGVTGPDTCRAAQVDGETVRVHGAGELSPQGLEALAALVRVAKRGLEAEASGEAWEGLRSVAFDAVAGALEERDHWLPEQVRRRVADAVLTAVALRAKGVS